MLGDIKGIEFDTTFFIFKIGGQNMLDKRKHFMINKKIQDMLFELQKKFSENSEGTVIRRAIVELYQKEFK